MKCICPMGGNRTCPDDCFIAVWHLLPDDQKTKERRRPIVEQLAKQGYTQKAVAMQLGVSQNTISKDLETLSIVDNVKGQGKDTLGRKKSTGRPKGTRGAPKPHPKRDEIIARADQGLSDKAIAVETGIPKDTVRREVERENLERKAAALIDPATLSMTAQEKLDAAIRQHKRKLDMEFEARCREDCQRWLNEVGLPQYLKELTKLEQSISNRKGIMNSITYRKIRACLHPDRVQDPVLKKRYEESFRLFTELEKRVLDEKESPTTFRTMPRTYEELMAMKAKVQAERRAKRNTKHQSVR